MRDYNREHKDVPEHKYAYDFDQTIRECMVRTFRPFYPPSGKAMELGCYKGDFTTLLLEAFSDLTVVDASDELIAVAQVQVANPSVRFIHSTFENLEVPAAYDAIFLLHTLEHLDDPAGVLARIRDWLSPDGRLFIAVPNANAPSRQIAVRMGLIEHNTAVTDAERAHGHRRTYALDTLLRDVRASGLRVEDFGGVLFKPLANFQFDQMLERGLLSKDYVEGCYQLGKLYPDLCASIYTICRR